MSNVDLGLTPTVSVDNICAVKSSYHFNSFHSKLRLICLNIRLMRQNFITLQAESNQIIHDLGVIILIETNITDDEINLLNITNFNCEYVNRGYRRGGGIAVFIRDKFQYSISKSIKDTFEFLVVKLSHFNFVLPIVCVYRAPSTTNTNLFCNEFEVLVEALPKSSDVVVVGDMNIDLFKENVYVAEYLDMMSAMGLVNLNPAETTREDLARQTKTNIDHIFARSIKNIHTIESNIVKKLVSDHFLIFATIIFKNGLITNRIENQERNFLNGKKVGSLISNFHWSQFNNETDANSLYAKLKNAFKSINTQSLFNKSFKLRRSNCDWMNVQILNMCKDRDKLYKKCRRKPNDLARKSDYSKLRDRVNKMIVFAKNTLL